MLLLLVAMPNKLRLEPAARYTGENVRSQRLSRLMRLDFLGVLSLVGTSVLLTTALQQAAEGYLFSAPEVLTLLVLAAVSLVCFLVWQWFITGDSHNLDPVLSWHLITNRVFMAALW